MEKQIWVLHTKKTSLQPERRSVSWAITIRTQRERCNIRLRKTPSLQSSLTDEDWLVDVWADAVDQATKDTNLDIFPNECLWQMSDVLKNGWLPEN